MRMPRDAERMCWDRQLGSWSRDRLNVDAFAVRLGPEHEIGGNGGDRESHRNPTTSGPDRHREGAAGRKLYEDDATDAGNTFT